VDVDVDVDVYFANIMLRCTIPGLGYAGELRLGNGVLELDA
jgi:hypothetical protein